MTRAVLALALALAGSACTSYAHRSLHNAPGLTDLATPPAREVGDPDAFEPATEPGTRTIATFLLPHVMIGAGRLDVGQPATELGLEVRVERTVAADRALLHDTAWGITVGAGLAQFTPNRPTMFGPLHAELNYRFPSAWGVMPTDIGLGPVVYPGAHIATTMQDLDPEVGAQLTVRVPIVMLRTRYLPTSGAEIWIGFEVPIAFFFGRSR